MDIFDLADEELEGMFQEREEKILKYAASHCIEITKSYTDAEETHTASDGFTRLLEDGARRRFDHVLIDSVFTAGRDVTAAKYVLLGTFFPAGIHFTAVSDGFTSRGRGFCCRIAKDGKKWDSAITSHYRRVV